MLNPGIQAGWSSPPTLEAVTGLMAAQDMYCRMRWEDVFEEAQSGLEEAPDFPPLLYMLASAYAWSNRLFEADSVLSRLLSLRERMTSEEQRLADWFHGNLYGDHDESTRAADQLFRINPADYGWHAAVSSMITNDFDDALERLQAFDAESPCGRVFAPYWEELAKAYHMLGRYEDELDAARRGLSRDPSWRSLVYYEATALAGLDRLDAVDSLLDVIAGLPSETVEWNYMYSPGMQTTYVALELKALGNREAYETVMDRALAWFETLPADSLREWRAMALYYAERWADADTLFAALIAEQPQNFEHRGHRGITLAHLGQRDEAMRIDQWLEQLDLPFLVQARATRLRAAIAAALGDRVPAVQLLQQAYSEGMHLGYFHHRDPEWESLRDYRAYQELLTPEGN
jgi:tetratricopeptide (TPR) repeat protein